MTEEATQQSVSKRDRDMEELLKSRDQEREPEEPEDVKTKEPEPVETIIFTDDAGKEYQVPKNSKTKFKIDGEEIEAPVTTAFSRYQKGAAGDKRLQEASRVRQQLEEQQRQLNEQYKALQQERQAFEQTREADPPQDDHNVDKLTDALIEADSDEAKKLLEPLFQKPGIDTEAINKEVESRLSNFVEEQERQKQAEKQVKFQNDLLDARAWFEDNYKVLNEDEMLFNLVNQKTGVLYEQNPHDDPKKIIKKAADEVLAWHKKMVKTKKPTVPTPVSGRASIGADEKPVTRKDILNEQRKARGQPPL